MAIALQTNPDSRLNGIRVFQKTLFVEANGFWTFPPPRSRESSTYTRLAECARLELGKLVSLRTMARLNPISWLAVWKSSWLISVMTIDVVVRANVCTRGRPQKLLKASVATKSHVPVYCSVCQRSDVRPVLSYHGATDKIANEQIAWKFLRTLTGEVNFLFFAFWHRRLSIYLDCGNCYSKIIQYSRKY